MAINAIQAAIRSMTGTERQFNGDLHAYWDQLGIPPGQFAERMVAWKQLPQNAAWIDATEDADAPEVVDGLWRNGERGVWYDSSDLSTMFQDPAGTTPVYMPGQGQPDPWIGLQLDKRLGLVRGPERLTNGDFSAGGASWAVAGSDATHIVTFSGGVLRFQSDTTTPQLSVAQLGTLVVGRWYEITVTTSAWVSGGVKSDAFVQGNLLLSTGVGTVKCVAVAANSSFNFTRNSANVDLTIDSISVRELPGNHRWQGTATSRAVLSARYNLLTGTESLATQSVTVAATAYTLTTAGPGSVTLSGAASGTYTAGSRMVTCSAGALTLTVSGGVTQADLRPANDGVGLPPYQRVVDASTYDTAGFPLYRKPDGVDDWMQTATVDYAGADKVTVVAATRKLSDSANQTILESSTAADANVGSFFLRAAAGGNPNYQFYVKSATGQAWTESAVAAPDSSVMLLEVDFAAGARKVRRNGALSFSGVFTGGGTLGNYPLYFDRRAGTTLPSAARDYGTIIVGRLLTGPETAAVEKFLRQKSRAY